MSLADETPMTIDIGHGIKRNVNYRMSMPGLTSVDVDAPEDKWAIYLLNSLITRATPETNTATIAHELLHVYRRPDPKNMKLEQLMAMQGKSEVERYYTKEKEVERAEEFFEEPVSSMLVLMEKKKSQLGAGKQYTKDAEQVPASDILERIIGPSYRELMGRLMDRWRSAQSPV